jgi:rubrerythrin
MERSITGLATAYDTAIEFEKKGREFYLHKASEASELLGQKLFTALAEDEIAHAERIEQLKHHLLGEGVMPQAPHAVHALREKLKTFFNQHRAQLSKKSTNLEIYEFAMGMESQGITMYTELAAASQHEAEKKFFLALIEEEKSHLEAIRNVHFFLSETGNWNENEESRRWNWMNL